MSATMTPRDLEARAFAVADALWVAESCIPPDIPDSIDMARTALWSIAGDRTHPDDPAVILMPLSAWDMVRHHAAHSDPESADAQWELIRWALSEVSQLCEQTDGRIHGHLADARDRLDQLAAEIETERVEAARHLVEHAL